MVFLSFGDFQYDGNLKICQDLRINIILNAVTVWYNKKYDKVKLFKSSRFNILSFFWHPSPAFSESTPFRIPASLLSSDMSRLQFLLFR